MEIIIRLIQLIADVLSFLLVAYVALSYFMSPYHPVRQTIDRVVAPLLSPIRRYMPRTGALDFSPLILMILIQLVEIVLVGAFRSLGS